METLDKALVSSFNLCDSIDCKCSNHNLPLITPQAVIAIIEAMSHSHSNITEIEKQKIINTMKAIQKQN